MCDPVTLSLTGAALLGTAYGASRIKKDKKKTNAQINAINKKVEEHIEANKLANSVQTTEPTTNTALEEKLKQQQQKVPLNTAGTGVTTLPSTVGLNLGGY